MVWSSPHRDMWDWKIQGITRKYILTQISQQKCDVSIQDSGSFREGGNQKIPSDFSGFEVGQSDPPEAEPESPDFAKKINATRVGVSGWWCVWVVFLFKYRVLDPQELLKRPRFFKLQCVFSAKKHERNTTTTTTAFRPGNKKNTKWRTLERCFTWKREACHWFVVDPSGPGKKQHWPWRFVRPWQSLAMACFGARKNGDLPKKHGDSNKFAQTIGNLRVSCSIGSLDGEKCGTPQRGFF